MKRILCGLALACTCMQAANGFGQAVPAEDRERALAIEREFERLAGERSFWPGFDPLTIPLAIYTGEHTYLFRHPAPPPGFTPAADAGPAALVMAGRHPAVTSNTSADIGGTVAATLLADGQRATLGANQQAAAAVHESFHVFQRKRHAGWAGNEGDLFLYPTDQAPLLALRRLESAGLRRALAAGTAADAACWAKAALNFRRERFAAMEKIFPQYERLTELNEGLASYLQILAEGRKTIAIAEIEFPAGGVRQRIYTIGPALAFVLDRLSPAWKTALEADDKTYLDQLLESAVQADPYRGIAACAFSAEERARVETDARADTAAVVRTHGERRRAFDARSGWRVEILAAQGRPLWPKGFDPLNVEPVEGGYLHTRFLRLGNDEGEMRAIDEGAADIDALTAGAGKHPLFNGVRQVTVAGLARPRIETVGDKVTLDTAGFTAQFQRAAVEIEGTTVRVRLEAPGQGSALLMLRDARAKRTE